MSITAKLIWIKVDSLETNSENIRGVVRAQHSTSKGFIDIKNFNF